MCTYVLDFKKKVCAKIKLCSGAELKSLFRLCCETQKKAKKGDATNFRHSFSPCCHIIHIMNSVKLYQAQPLSSAYPPKQLNG